MRHFERSDSAFARFISVDAPVVNYSCINESDKQEKNADNTMDDVRILQTIPGFRAVPSGITQPVFGAKAFWSLPASYSKDTVSSSSRIIANSARIGHGRKSLICSEFAT